MKKLLFIISLASVTLQGFSQKLEKYEDVLPRILALPPSGALAELKLYLADEPDNGSIYLQMGVIYQRRYENSDPIKDYAYKLGNAEEALKAYQLAENFITERDVRKDEEYFFNFGTIDEKGRIDVEYDTVKNHLATMKVELSEYIKFMPAIYEKFTQSFSHYDQAHKLFTQILGEYPTYKDLYLLFNKDVDDQFELIKEEYLLSIQYWDEYLKAKDSLDIGYDQKLKIEQIEVYRLDGLESKINFLQESIHVWDYATWVDKTRKTIDAEIAKLRVDLASENIRLSKRVEQAIPDFIREDFEPLKVSKEILFNLRKYDLNSVIEPIFIFKEKKHNLVYQEMLNQSLDTTQDVDVDRKLYLYGQMINHIRNADSVLADIKRRNTESSLDKYEEFISMHYQGMNGIDQMVSEEQNSNAEDFENYVGDIKNTVFDLLRRDSVAEVLKYKRLEVPLQTGFSVDNDQLTSPVTTHRVENFDGSTYIGGIYKNEKEGLTAAYVCGITPEKTMGWFNEYILQMDSARGFDSHTRIGAMQAVPGGLALILNGVDTSNVRMNHLLILDEKGLVTHSRRLLLNQFPRTMAYNERTNTLFVTYKGGYHQDDILLENELIMANYSIYGDLLWQKRISYKGDIVDVVGIDGGYLLIGNYHEIKGMDGRINRAGRSNTDTKLFALKIDLSGEIRDFRAYNFGNSYFANKTYKISDDCINLFGSSGSYQERLDLDENPTSAIHIIVNKDMEVIANSLN